MKNIEQIATELRLLAMEVGGNHHTNKETEKILERLANDLSEVNLEYSLAIHSLFDKDFNYTGISKSYRHSILRERNINN